MKQLPILLQAHSSETQLQLSPVVLLRQAQRGLIQSATLSLQNVWTYELLSDRTLDCVTSLLLGGGDVMIGLPVPSFPDMDTAWQRSSGLRERIRKAGFG